jgi:hypothetical protein
MPHFKGAYALLIGVGDYLVSPAPARPGFRNLPATVSDAQAVARILTNPTFCGYLPDNVQLLLGEQATADNIRAAWKELARSADPQSTAVIYFSGHGGRAVGGQGQGQSYLCPREADPADLDHTAISGHEFSAALDHIPAQKLLVVLDCCHAAGSADLKATSGQLLWKAGLSEDYYQALASGAGRVVLASCKESEYSFVRDEGDLSLFTYHLCEALKGRAGVRGDGLVRVLDVYHHVNQAVHTAKPEQTPILKVKDMDLNFPIALDRGGTKTAAGVSTTVSSSQRQWLEQRRAELSRPLETYNRRIKALEGDIAQALDAERRAILEERLDAVLRERRKVQDEIKDIARQLQ